MTKSIYIASGTYVHWPPQMWGSSSLSQGHRHKYHYSSSPSRCSFSWAIYTLTWHARSGVGLEHVRSKCSVRGSISHDYFTSKIIFISCTCYTLWVRAIWRYYIMPVCILPLVWLALVSLLVGVSHDRPTIVPPLVVCGPAGDALWLLECQSEFWLSAIRPLPWMSLSSGCSWL